MRTSLRCVYCPREGTTKDHVIPRCLLEKPYPTNLNLLTVPSCGPCNRGYSKDEEYFRAVMALTGFVPSLINKVEQGGVVDRMLERSAGLDTHFQASMKVAEDGRIYIQPDENRISRVTQKVAFGLYYFRYRPAKVPLLDDFLAIKPFHDHDQSNLIIAMAHTERFRPRRWMHVQTLHPINSPKVQVFDYMFVRNWIYRDFGRLFCIMRFHETVWAAVRCPHPPKRKRAKGQLGSLHAGEQLKLTSI